MEGLLWLSERYPWFWFNEKKGWTVLIGVAVVGVTMLIMLLWFVASLLFRWRFQFSIRSLLVLTVAVALPCSWLAVEMQEAKRERESAAAIERLGGRVVWSGLLGPAALRSLLGDDFLQTVDRVDLHGTAVTNDESETLKGLTRLQDLVLRRITYTNVGMAYDVAMNRRKRLATRQVSELWGSKITDAGLEHLKGPSHLTHLDLGNTEVTDEGVKKLQQALPKCKIYH